MNIVNKLNQSSVSMSWNKLSAFGHLAKVEVRGVGVVVYSGKAVRKCWERSLDRVQKHFLRVWVERKPRDVRDASLRTHVGWNRIGETQWLLIGSSLGHQVWQAQVKRGSGPSCQVLWHWGGGNISHQEHLCMKLVFFILFFIMVKQIVNLKFSKVTVNSFDCLEP